MKWVTFNDRPSYDAYHLASCTAQGIPRPGYSAVDNSTVRMNAGWTQAWVGIFGAFLSASGTKLLCYVPDADVVTYNLAICPNNPNLPFNGPHNIVFEGATRTIFSVANDWMQPKPPTWTDPKTGIVYPVT